MHRACGLRRAFIQFLPVAYRLESCNLVIVMGDINAFVQKRSFLRMP